MKYFWAYVWAFFIAWNLFAAGVYVGEGTGRKAIVNCLFALAFCVMLAADLLQIRWGLR